MGCCQSAPRGQFESSEYASAGGNAELSRALPQNSSAVSGAPDPRPDLAQRQSTRQSHRNRRDIAPGEHFNAPLRPHIWNSQRAWTRTELDRERREFFETRVTGRMEIWATLQTVVELMLQGELPTAQSILDAAAITVPTGNLKNGVYDESGNLYQLPDHIISDPENLVVETSKGSSLHAKDENAMDEEEESERRREAKGKNIVKAGDMIRVKARLSDRGGPDMIISLGRKDNVRSLIRSIQEEAKIAGNGKIRIAYMGKILKEGESLTAQGWRDGHVVNALVFT